jgi:4,5-dihydroxyphthalate decarboxylase
MPITLALEAYDRTQALLDGRVAVPGVRLVIVDSGPRHERMLLDGGYDVAELSMSSYILARARGAALTAIPVFPRRLFSPSCVYVRRGLTDPAQLAGGRIGVYSLQFTMSVVARGDLHEHFGVHMGTITWVRTGREIVPHRSPLMVEERPGADLWALLAEGTIDAVISPDVPAAFETGRVARLFPAFARVERDLYGRTRVYPIMHTIALQEARVAERPSLSRELYAAFLEAKAIAGRHLRQPYATSLVWGRASLEEQEALLGDPYSYGLGEGNLRALEYLMRYQTEQGLLDQRVLVERLFADVFTSSAGEGS